VRILALVTARGGSKRIPGKNLRLLGGRPLVAWSIEVITGVPEICQILVSTDDPEIAAAARAAGASVPWLRPAALASDTASSVDVCLHALDWYESEQGPIDGLLLLQPTSPFRRRVSVLRGVELFRTHERRAVIGVSPAGSHPYWCFTLEGETLRPYVPAAPREQRSQDLPPAYVVNGAFYLIAPADLRARRAFLSDDAVPLLMEDPAEAIDIDTEWDWTLAQAALTGARVGAP
jgi:N-acylneuraminate cytidylyltransferase